MPERDPHAEREDYFSHAAKVVITLRVMNPLTAPVGGEKAGVHQKPHGRNVPTSARPEMQPVSAVTLFPKGILTRSVRTTFPTQPK